MIAPHCLALMAPVPESVRKSISTSSACRKNGFRWAAARRDSRSASVVMRMGSTDLMRNGSIRVCGIGYTLSMR